MVGEQAQEDVGTDPRRLPVADRADLQSGRLQGAEGALDPGEVLVGLHCLGGIQPVGRHAGADHVQAVEPGLGGDGVLKAPPGQAAVSDVDGDVLGHLVRVEHGADQEADLGGAAPARAAASDLVGDA